MKGRHLQEQENTASLAATSSTACQPDALKMIMLVPSHHGGCLAGAETSNWQFSLASHSAGKNEFLIDSGAATAV